MTSKFSGWQHDCGADVLRIITQGANFAMFTLANLRQQCGELWALAGTGFPIDGVDTPVIDLMLSRFDFEPLFVGYC
jgi:hypothetical protein